VTRRKCPNSSSHSNVGLNGGGHLFRRIEGAISAAVLDVLVGFGQTGVDDAALGRRVFLVGSGEPGTVDDEFGSEDDLTALERRFHKVAFGDAGQGS